MVFEVYADDTQKWASPRLTGAGRARPGRRQRHRRADAQTARHRRRRRQRPRPRRLGRRDATLRALTLCRLRRSGREEDVLMTDTADLKPRSRDVTDGMEKAAARGMLRAVGMTDDDFGKPQIGVASSWNEITPCNLSLDRLAKAAKDGVHAAGGYPLEFGTISVSDGISMGHEGMHFSLVSREVIADSVEVVMQAERLDGAVLLAGCDKSLPGMLMAAARLDLAAVFLYAGSILPGVARLSDGSERQVTIIDAFEAVGACARGSDEPRGPRRDRAGDLPGRGRLRRHVHREHDGQRRRGAGHVAARLGRSAGHRPAPRRLRPPLRPGRGRDAPPRHHRPRRADPRGVRERDRGGDGLRRLHQRRAASARDRPRGARRPVPRRLQPDRREGAAPGRREAVRPVRHDRRRPRRRGARW